MKSFGLWLLSVTLLGMSLGCGETAKEEPKMDPAPAADDAGTDDPAAPATDPAP